MKTALAQIEILPGKPWQNTQKILNLIAEAKENKADIIIFPEMAVPGYLLGDTWEQTAFLDECTCCNQAITEAAKGIIVIWGSIAQDKSKKNNDGHIRKYNACFAAQNGKLLQNEVLPYPFIPKTLLPNYREFDDSRHFFSLQQLALENDKKPSDYLKALTLTINNKAYKTACLICEDGWDNDYALSPLKIMQAKDKLDLIINISSSPFTLGKNDKRHRVFSQQAKNAQAPLIYVNNVGLQNNGKTLYTFDGASTVYDPKGNIVKELPAYQEKLALLDTDLLKTMPAQQQPAIADIYRALHYGGQKFLQNIHMDKVVIGISGGIDSAVAAALYAKILPPEKVLLVNMPSIYNSALTKGLAQQLADNLGCPNMIIPIQPAVELTKKQFQDIPVYRQGKETGKLTLSSFILENIQARDRSSRVLAAAAAAFGGGFTCNANKAETTVGYSTLYGDQAGFLALLGDLWKYQIYELAHYLNDVIYKKEVIPQGIIDIVPSAELSAEQDITAGQGDPLKYPYHDFLFRAFVERWEKATPEDVLRWYHSNTLDEELGCPPGTTAKYFPDAKVFIEDLEYWWNRFNGIAIAKRIQAPPIMAVSRRAFGFDYREAQNGPYYTQKYLQLKKELLIANK